ncbi:hypothetical protein ASA01S_118_00020 [Aeromonas salmonicida subsp. masoucida NBRC 13784]|nr:hypothetical protein ASA01S_118_00020 [Aeromonas salmonicida subsp. masoucida NBRC 13784]
MLGVERGTTWPTRYSIGTHTELGIKRRQRLLPACNLLRIGIPLLMTEEVDVEWPQTAGGKPSSLRRSVGLSMAAGKEPRQPAPVTASASALFCTPAMGA